MSLLWLALTGKSQLKLPVLNNAFSADIKVILKEYPGQFSDIMGTIIQENPQSIEYASKQQLSGAEASSIIQYSSGSKKVYSWQATMLTTEEYDEAAKKYKSLYSQLNNMAVKMKTGVTFYLKGKYASPTDEKKFNSSFLAFEKPDEPIRKMLLEISMQYLFPEWKVSLRIYEKERNDNERGNSIED